MYPPIPVGVGTKSNTDPAIAPVAIEAASGVAVPPLGRQKRREMHVDAMARDAVTEMMLPKIPPQHLVMRSRVEGLFNEANWFPGKIEAIRPGKNRRKQIVVRYDDGSHESYWSHKAADMDDLRYDQTKDEPEPETYQWNICHHLLCDEQFRWSPCHLCPLTGRQYKGAAWTKHLQRLLTSISSGTCASDPRNLAKVETFLIEIALKHLDQGGVALIHNSVVTSSEWAKHVLSMLGESLAKRSNPLGQDHCTEYEPEGAVNYSREDSSASQAVGPAAWSPANEQTGASNLRPEGDIFEFNILRPRIATPRVHGEFRRTWTCSWICARNTSSRQLLVRLVRYQHIFVFEK